MNDASAPARAPICQTRIPFDVTPRSLPGIRPLQADDWLMVDEAFGAQMAYRSELLKARRSDVLSLQDSARPAAEELLATTLALLGATPERGYRVSDSTVTRPDGLAITLQPGDPLGNLGQLVQEDLCILEKRGQEHVLTGAVLCFPASWRLDEKFGRPMTVIHAPVPSYDSGISRRVQRLFDGVQLGKPLWRFNRLWYVDAELYQPRSENGPPRPRPGKTGPRFFRCEKQSIFRLPRTQAVIFSIHTFVLSEQDAPPEAFQD